MRTVNRPQMLQRAMTMCAVVAATASSSVLAFQPGSCSSAASTFAARPHVALRRPAAVQAARGSRVWAPACARKKAALMSLSMVEDFKALVEAAEPDATIVLKAGTYVITDKLLIEKDLYIEAEEGQAGKVVITDPDGSDPEDFFLEVRGCGVAFDGVQVVKSGGNAKGAGCVCVLDDGRVTFFNQPPLEIIF